MKNKKGITLISLVITIIILLILVSITLNSIMGNDGILKKAKDAATKYQNSQDEELAYLNNLENMINGTSNSLKQKVQKNEFDINVMPDEYNTGCQISNLTAFTTEGIYGDLYLQCDETRVVFASSKNGTTNQYKEFFVEGCDFSTRNTFTFNGDTPNGLKITFRNCVFNNFSSGILRDDKVIYEFENCTIAHIDGANIRANRCKFGKGTKDGINPNANCRFENCYIRDLASAEAEGNPHADGTQMFGYYREDVQADIEGIYFNNCRYEIPANGVTDKTAAVNSCIMICPEYDKGYDITFENCYLNGGGNSLQIGYKNKGTIEGNVNVRNINFGCTAAYNYTSYSHFEEGKYTVSDLKSTSSLYVGSVWKDSKNERHISVTNDTAIERKLAIVTENGIQIKDIPACWIYDEFKEGAKKFSEFPFDIDINVGKTDWVVCYDLTSGKPNQIRYVNDTEEDVFIDLSKLGKGEIHQLASGTWKDNIQWTLNSLGVLTISGTGGMSGFNSTNLVNKDAWYAYDSYINTVVIKEGVTSIAGQAFRCKYITDLYLPKSLTEIGNSAFANSSVLRLYYSGTETEWNNISIGDNVDGNIVIHRANKTFMNTRLP